MTCFVILGHSQSVDLRENPIMTTLIRPAQPDDVSGIARVHVDSWRTTYKGMMPDEVLANLRTEDRERTWGATIERIQAGTSTSCIFVAETDDQIVGFACGGRERGDHPVYKGELYAIYLLKEYQGQGIGRALWNVVAERLVEQGHTAMLIWVAAENPAVRFYEAMGGHPVGTQSEDYGGKPIEEIAYGYDDLPTLLARGKT
jgi:ribosomal protein S18 acetylase RimI-like enzyme